MGADSDLRDRIAASWCQHAGLGKSCAYCRDDADAVMPLIREAQAEAWEQGFDAGEQDVIEHGKRGWRRDDPCIPNPYRDEDAS